MRSSFKAWGAAIWVPLLFSGLSGYAAQHVFSPNFFNLKVPAFEEYFKYYEAKGMGLRTLSSYLSEGELLVSGSFQTNVPFPAHFHNFLTEVEFLEKLKLYERQGFRPREVSATLDREGNPRFNAIWQKLELGIAHTSYNLSDQEYDQNFNHLFAQGFRVEDHFSYNDHGTRKHMAVFVKDGEAKFYAIYGYLPADYLNFSNRVFRLGYRPTSIQIEDFSSDDRVGGVFMKTSGEWEATYGMSIQEFQQQFGNYTAKGFQLKKIQAYKSSTRFSAIWAKE